MHVTDKTVWITGASSGIGEALAGELSQRGARLALSARRTEELKRVRSSCAHPDQHVVIPLDLTVRDSMERAVDDVIAQFGHVDVMVHNGGVSQRSLAKDTDLAVDRRIMEINYFGAVTLTKLLLPPMLERGQGHFVAVSSLVGKFGTPMRSAYAASKHALHGFFDSLRAEVYEDGLRVTLVCPGFVKTKVGHNALTEDGTPLGKKKDVREIGMAPEKCARIIARAIQKEKDEIYFGGWEQIAVYLKRWLPSGLFNQLLRRVEGT